VAGTATAVSNRVSRRQAGRWAAQEDQAAQEQQVVYAAPPPAPASADPMASRLDQLKDLADLKAQGILSEAEFEQQKKAILNS
jgi:hypothetical protein